MGFNRDDFDENVFYCEYVYKMNLMYELNLNKHDVQRVANMYVDVLEERGSYDPYDVPEDNELLIKIANYYKKYLKTNSYNNEDSNEFKDIPATGEKNYYAHGGYDIVDSYNDL